MSKVKLTLLALIGWTWYSAKYDRYQIKGEKLDLSYDLRLRWYSPTYWFLALLTLPLYVIDGGILEWLVTISDEVFGPPRHRQNGGEWTDQNVPLWKRRWVAWVRTYEP